MSMRKSRKHNFTITPVVAVKLQKFTIHWLDGNTEVVEGEDIADACNRAGIQQGALVAMDYYDYYREPRTTTK